MYVQLHSKGDQLLHVTHTVKIRGEVKCLHPCCLSETLIWLPFVLNAMSSCPDNTAVSETADGKEPSAVSSFEDHRKLNTEKVTLPKVVPPARGGQHPSRYIKAHLFLSQFRAALRGHAFKLPHETVSQLNTLPTQPAPLPSLPQVLISQALPVYLLQTNLSLSVCCPGDPI